MAAACWAIKDNPVEEMGHEYSEREEHVLLSMVSDRARSEHRSIWLVDQRLIHVTSQAFPCNEKEGYGLGLVRNSDKKVEQVFAKWGV